jgi:hypothetical protein
VDRGRVADLGRRVGAWLFGDRVGLTVFLGTLVFVAAYWRIGFLITDSRTVANALVNVADGRLAVVDTPYSLTLGSLPGLVEGVNGQSFGRNYGHVFVSLPFLWALEVATALFDLRVFLAACWSLLVLLFAWQLGIVTARRSVQTAGALAAAVLFLGNVALATDLAADRTAIVALQASTVVAAALTATLLYRAVRLFEGRAVGAAAGAAVALATPVGFWASVPKRHVVTTAVVAAVIYLFARTRTDDSIRPRAAMYAVVGLYTLVHPFEALFLLLVVAPLDLLSAPSNGVRDLAGVAAVFLLSLVPLFVVNLLVAGNPIEPPRMLPGVSPDADQALGEGLRPESPEASGGGGAGDGTGAGGNTESLGLPLGTAGRIVGWLERTVAGGLAALGNPGGLYHTFVRSGWIESVTYPVNDFESIELALAESFPLVALGTGYLVHLGRRVRRDTPAWPGSPGAWTSLLSVVLAAVLAFVYLPRLPLHTQITPRYLMPTVPALLFLVARVPKVAETVRESPGWLVRGYLGTVLLGGLALGGVLTAVDPAIGEAMQLHALAALGTGLVATVVLVVPPLSRDARVGAVALGLPAGATTLFLLFSGVEYFDYGSFALGVTRWLSRALQIL